MAINIGSLSDFLGRGPKPVVRPTFQSSSRQKTTATCNLVRNIRGLISIRMSLSIPSLLQRPGTRGIFCLLPSYSYSPAQTANSQWKFHSWLAHFPRWSRGKAASGIILIFTSFLANKCLPEIPINDDWNRDRLAGPRRKVFRSQPNSGSFGRDWNYNFCAF